MIFKGIQQSIIMLIVASLCSANSFVGYITPPSTVDTEAFVQNDFDRTLTIFVPREIKKEEGRVALTPSGIRELLAWAEKEGIPIEIRVEAGAGKYCNISDEDFKKAGTRIVTGDYAINQAYRTSQIILKVKEPIANDERNEFALMQPNQIWFTYFHLASSKDLTFKLLSKQIIALALETITHDEPDKPRFPCLFPMSVAAGYEAILYSLVFRTASSVRKGKIYIDENKKNKIFSLFPQSLVSPIITDRNFARMITQQAQLSTEHMVIWGGGTSGRAALAFALRLGIQKITVIEKFDSVREKLEKYYKDDKTGDNHVEILSDTDSRIIERLQEAGIIITATYIKGDKPKKVITKKMLKTMAQHNTLHPRSHRRIIIPIDIDQGGAIEFVDNNGNVVNIPIGNHIHPGFFDHYGNIICSVANLPGLRYLVSPTTSQWLETARLPYLKALIKGICGNTKNTEAIKKGLRKAIELMPGMQTGINLLMGDVSEENVAKIFSIQHTPLDTSL